MRRFLLVSILALGLIGVTALPGEAQSEDQPLFVEVNGHGWGHGRGMGQYGAQGYALDEGWTSAQILDHFYGGTNAGPIPANAPVDPTAVRVELRSQRGAALTVDVADAKIHIRDPDGILLFAADGDSDGGADLAPGAAARLSIAGGGIRFEQAPTCAGPWTEQFTVGFGSLELAATSAAAGSAGLLRVCHTDGSSTWYDGTLRFHNQGGDARTVNVVSIEQYLRGVLPAEVPSSWESAALESQAIAARSYAMAGDTRQQPYGDTCDTIRCQVYRGRYRQSEAAGFVTSTHGRTDAAVAATAGMVRIRGGAVARTEFSSSTGGHTAGGVFPAVIDDGDDVASNPNHDWTKVVDLGPFVTAQGKGDLVSVSETGNGLGSDGGRVLSVTFVFTDGSTTLTGNQVRQTFGLKSDWFAFGPIVLGAVSANANFVDAAYNLFLRRDPTSDERSQWVVNLGTGAAKTELTNGLAQSDEWAGVMIDDLYRRVLDRGSDSSGRAYWLGRMANGLRFEAVAANFYGAPEYYDRVGGTDAAFITSLYREILGREPDAGGLDFWVDRLERGAATPYLAAAGFYASAESRRDRVIDLYDRVLDRTPEAGGLAYWAGQLLVVDDVRLAATLAASPEFYEKAQP